MLDGRCEGIARFQKHLLSLQRRDPITHSQVQAFERHGRGRRRKTGIETHLRWLVIDSDYAIPIVRKGFYARRSRTSGCIVRVCLLTGDCQAGNAGQIQDMKGRVVRKNELPRILLVHTDGGERQFDCAQGAPALSTIP